MMRTFTIGEMAIVSVGLNLLYLLQFESLTLRAFSVITSNENVHDLSKQVGRGSLLSGGARSPYRRGLGFYFSSEEISCSEAKHLVARNIEFTTWLTASEATHANLSSNGSLKLPNKNGDNQVVGTFSMSEGKMHLPWRSN